MTAPASGVRPVVAVGVVVWHPDRDGRVLLIRRARPPRLGQWSIPGGRVERGETLEAAARREVWEETGVELGPLHFVAVFDAIYDREGAVTGTAWPANRAAGDGEVSPAASLEEAVDHFVLIDFTAVARSDRPAGNDEVTAVAWADAADLTPLGMWSSTMSVIARSRTLLDGDHPNVGPQERA